MTVMGAFAFREADNISVLEAGRRDALEARTTVDALEQDDALAPSKGILLGVFLGPALWITLGTLGWWLCH